MSRNIIFVLNYTKLKMKVHARNGAFTQCIGEQAAASHFLKFFSSIGLLVDRTVSPMDAVPS
jgi:hypothetical protein